jgi:hypothetical protein
MAMPESERAKPATEDGTTTPAARPTPKRRRAELGFLRLAGVLGIVGIGTAIAAILGTQDVDAWIVGLVVSCVSVGLGAILRQTLKP